MSEDKYPTIADLHAVLTSLIANGFGELPFQIVVAPDSTLQALARQKIGEKPALMIQYEENTGRNAVSFISTARLTQNAGGQIPSLRTQ